MEFEALEQKIGYVFEDEGILETALTHASMQQKKFNNERLEFLGDRVLGLVIAGLLYRLFPSESEGDLAKRHTALVQQKALVSVAEELGLGGYLKMSSGEKKAGGLQKETILSNALEALIAAVYLDGGFEAAEEFVSSFWEPRIENTAPPEDPKTLLQEWVQARGLPLPEYKVISRVGSDHAPQFEIEVSAGAHGSAIARASSKRAAEKEAAAALLLKITGKDS